MQTRRQTRRVVVPVQDVERRRRFAVQIIRHDVVPDQIVRPHPVEHTRGVLTIEHALPRGPFPRRLNGVVSHEQTGHRIFGMRVEHVDHQRQRRDSIGRGRAPPCNRARPSSVIPPAHAPTRGDAALPVISQRRFDARLDCVDVLRPVPNRDAPAVGLRHDTMNTWNPASSRNLDQALLGRHVVDVVLVDLRRHDEHRPRFDVRRRGRYCISSSIGWRSTTDPSVLARLPPTVKGVLSTCDGMPPLLSRSSMKLRAPLTRLCPRVSRAFLSADGLPSREVGRHQSVGGEPEQEVRALASESRTRPRPPIGAGALERPATLRARL